MIAGRAVCFNPFPGLRSFEPEEEHLFFGRERQVDELLVRLRRSRFLAVAGTSGSGKSSLVRSGLIPALHSGFLVRAGSSWRVAIFRPGDDPVGNLAAALNAPDVLGRGGEEIDRRLLETALRRSGKGLADAVRLARLAAGENLLVLVDQFEEIFRFKRNARIRDAREEAAAFVRLLLEALRQEEQPVYVCLTMRSDFVGNCTEFHGLTEAINEGQFLVPRMTREERRAAIVGPVAVGGGAITPRLVLRLLNDVGDDPDQLPILQHALMRTWSWWEEHREEGEPLDLRHYEAVGTLREALSLHAEEAFGELAGQREREIAETMFKALTDRGSDSRGIRRPLCVADVGELVGASVEEVGAVVERFRMPGRSFLMPPAAVPLQGETVLDISHESLMRVWTRLRQWVDEEARAAQVYLRLARAAAQYQEGITALWRDPELQLALNWREETRPTARWAERYDPSFERALLFLEQSRRERDFALEKREHRRRKALRRARWLVVVLGSATLITLIFGLSALTLKVKAEANERHARQQEREARRQKQNAERQQAYAQRQRESAERRKREAEQERNRAAAQERIANDERRHAESEKREAVAQTLRAEAALVEAREARRATEAQHRETLREKSRAEVLRGEAERSEAEAGRLARLQTARALALYSARLLEGGEQREIPALLALHAWRLHLRSGGALDDPAFYTALRQGLSRLDPASEAVWRPHQDAVRAVAVSPDGRTLVSAGDDGLVQRLDGPGRPPVPLGTLRGGARAVAFDPAGGRLAAGGQEGEVALYLPAGGSGRPPAGRGPVSALVFTGGRLAWGSGGRVGLWNPRSGEGSELAAAPGRRILAVASDAGGTRLAAAGGGDGAFLWDLAGRRGEARVLGAGRDVRAVALSEDGRLLVAGTGLGPILGWDLDAPGAAFELTGHTAAVSSLALRGDRLASASLDGSVRLWNLRRREQDPIALRDHAGWVWAVALTPDGEQVVSGGADRTVRLRWTRAERYAEAACRRLTRDLTREEWDRFLPAGLAEEPACPDLSRETP